MAISYSASADRAASIVSAMQAKSVQAKAYKADQADPEAAARLVSEVVQEFGRLDILVANAGILQAGAIDAEDTVALDRLHVVNAAGIGAGTVNLSD